MSWVSLSRSHESVHQDRLSTQSSIVLIWLLFVAYGYDYHPGPQRSKNLELQPHPTVFPRHRLLPNFDCSSDLRYRDRFPQSMAADDSGTLHKSSKVSDRHGKHLYRRSQFETSRLSVSEEHLRHGCTHPFIDLPCLLSCYNYRHRHSRLQYDNCCFGMKVLRLVRVSFDHHVFINLPE